jgi:hypothetical protein
MDSFEERQIRGELSGYYLEIAKGHSLLFDNIDSFVATSQNNTSVTTVSLHPFDSDPGNYEFWDKVGQIVGNLTELEVIYISILPYLGDADYAYDDDGDEYFGDADHDYDEVYEARTPNWETLTRILAYLRRKVELRPHTDHNDAELQDIPGLARAIHGHPMISGFLSSVDLTFANFWALGVLPWQRFPVSSVLYSTFRSQEVKNNAFC